MSQRVEIIMIYSTIIKLKLSLSLSAGIQSLSDLLSSLDRSVETRKRKNVEVLWIAATVRQPVK